MKDLAKNLPYPELSPLPVISDWVFTFFIFLITFAILVWLAWKLIKKFRSKRDISERQKIFPSDKKDIISELFQLKIEYLEKKKFREGLHELSGKLKSHFEKISGREIQEMTYLEICSTFEKSELMDFFREMIGVQFGKDTVTEKEMKHLYDNAIALIKKKPDLKIKKARVG